jgi:uncharacterized protein (DUF169 family)
MKSSIEISSKNEMLKGEFKMEYIANLQGKYSGPWTKVKFYKEKPNVETARELSNLRFCEAIKESWKTRSIILDRSSINCLGARYVFGWDDKKDEVIENCKKRWNISTERVGSIINAVEVLPSGINYIGLNVDGVPDVVVSYIQPKQFMHMLKTYENKTGKRLQTSLSSIMSICGSVVKAYLNKEIHISFGCEDSRTYGDIGRDRFAVAIPSNLVELFI